MTTITTTTTPRTQVLVRGSHAWRITKFNDRHFEAMNNRGVVHHYNSEHNCDRFWDFLESVGFKLRQEGWTLSTLKHQEPTQSPAATQGPGSFLAACNRNTPERVSDEYCEQIAAQRADK